MAEEFGGDTMFVDVSAKNGTNIEALQEAVLLTADAALDLRANPDQDAQGVAIEAHLDRGRGPVATVLVQRGTLRVGDSIVAGDAYGRVRACSTSTARTSRRPYPSRPVQVIGLTSVPGAGDNFLVVDEDRIARQIADRRSARKRNALAARARKRISLEDLESALKETSQLNLILKGDVSGSVEALEEALLGIQVGDEVELRVIDRGVGAITETNVNLAVGLGRDHHRLQRARRGQGQRAGQPRGRGDPLLLGHLPGDRRGREGPQGHAQARSTRRRQLGRAEIRAIFRSSQGRQHRRLPRAVGHHAAQRQGAAAARRRGGRREPHRLVAQAGEGRRHRGPRGLTSAVSTLTYNDIKDGDVIETYELVEKERGC